MRSRAASGEAELRAGKGSEIMPARAAGSAVRRNEESGGAGSRGKDEKLIKICGGMFLLLLRGGARVCYHTLDYV